MDKQLARLISDYQTVVRAAIVLMQRSGIPMPFSSADWIAFDIAENGELEGGIPYFKHGFGCEVGFLAVTCEGFKKLSMRVLMQESRPKSFLELIPQCDAIGKAIKQHSEPLRELRNKTFHLRNNVEAILQFFDKDADRLTWADDLHANIGRFFQTIASNARYTT